MYILKVALLKPFSNGWILVFFGVVIGLACAVFWGTGDIVKALLLPSVIYMVVVGYFFMVFSMGMAAIDFVASKHGMESDELLTKIAKNEKDSNQK